jgi:hypothetical protein
MRKIRLFHYLVFAQQRGCNSFHLWQILALDTHVRYSRGNDGTEYIPGTVGAVSMAILAVLLSLLRPSFSPALPPSERPYSCENSRNFPTLTHPTLTQSLESGILTGKWVQVGLNNLKNTAYLNVIIQVARIPVLAYETAHGHARARARAHAHAQSHLIFSLPRLRCGRWAAA